VVNIRRRPEPEKDAFSLVIERATSPSHSSGEKTKKKLKKTLEELEVDWDEIPSKQAEKAFNQKRGEERFKDSIREWRELKNRS